MILDEKLTQALESIGKESDGSGELPSKSQLSAYYDKIGGCWSWLRCC